jgi:hypothetical protein
MERGTAGKHSVKKKCTTNQTEVSLKRASFLKVLVVSHKHRAIEYDNCTEDLHGTSTFF